MFERVMQLVYTSAIYPRYFIKVHDKLINYANTRDKIVLFKINFQHVTFFML